MKILFEIPYLCSDFAGAVEAIDEENAWDGLAAAGRSINDQDLWEDVLDAAELPWLFLDGLLPDAVASQLPDLAHAPREKILEHTIKLLGRLASLDLQGASLDLGVDHLVWAHREGDGETVKAEFERRRDIVCSLLPGAQRLACRLYLTLRHPWAPITDKVDQLTLDLLAHVGHPDCQLMLNAVVDELPDTSPEKVLDRFIDCLGVLRIHYEPQLGIRLSDEENRTWASYLRRANYEGLVVFAPAVSSIPALRAELARLRAPLAEAWE